MKFYMSWVNDLIVQMYQAWFGWTVHLEDMHKSNNLFILFMKLPPSLLRMFV